MGRVLGQLRHETSHRLEAAGIDLHWPVSPVEEDDTLLPYMLYKSLGSGHREVVSNIVRHAQAGRVEVCVSRDVGCLVMIVQDDGVGLAASPKPDGPGGMGLVNLARRFEELGGLVDYPAALKGLCVRLSLPLVIDETRFGDVASVHG